MLGLTLVKVDINSGNDEVLFETDTGKKFKLHHFQDCCESVSIEDVCGDIEDLLNVPLLEVDESSSSETPEGVVPVFVDDSFTWTFYRLRTIKGGVTIRWYGSSNGCYSESVDFTEV